MLNFAGPGKPGPKPPRRYPCGMCGGAGTVPAGGRRAGDTTCPQCRGRGEV